MKVVFKNVRVNCKYPRAVRPLLGVSSLVSGCICWLSTPQQAAVHPSPAGPQPRWPTALAVLQEKTLAGGAVPAG